MARNMIVVWYYVKKYFGQNSSVSVFSPIWTIDSFSQGKDDGGLKSWDSKDYGK